MQIHGHGTGKPILSGITALEMLITMAIVSLLLVSGLPALQQFIWHQQIKAATTALQLRKPSRVSSLDSLGRAPMVPWRAA